MKNRLQLLVILALTALSIATTAQTVKMPYVESIENAKLAGITVDGLDSVYESAVHVDNTKAVFKTEKEQDSLIKEYTVFLRGFGEFLDKHEFKWGQPTKLWNRIYFNADGTVEYYLYSFHTAISVEREKQFQELLRTYLASHKIGITGPRSFAQCSPVMYVDK